ncbi:MAG: VOC family protein [Planctomycetes bacterium]|nr:VOC family protein [Planctomycetota bacterium]
MAKAKKKAAKKPAAKKAAPKKAAAKKPASAAKAEPAVSGVGPVPAVQPYLCVKDPAAALAFYEKAFGFTTRYKLASPDGKVQHAEIGHGNGRIMLGPECPQSQDKAPSTIGGTAVTLYVYVANVDAVTASAKATGGIVVQEPQDMFWGDRCATVADPEGHRWCLATHVKDVTPQEIEKAMQSMQPVGAPN